MINSRAACLCTLILAGTHFTVAPLPDVAEYSRVTRCLRINGFIDFTAPASRAEQLPPCLAGCPSGTETVSSQCVWPSLGEEELRLRFELFERCQPSSCQFLDQWDSHIKVVGMKVAQFLGIPLQEMKEAMLFWSTRSWPLPDGSPRLANFLISRRGEDDFPDRRNSEIASERWYLLHMTFRVDSARISLGSRPVRALTSKESDTLSAFLGTEVEVQRPQAETNEQRTGNVYSHADYQAVYQFEGFDPNQNPFQSATTTEQAQDPCQDPCFVADEQVHQLGAHRCHSACDCVGERTCTGHGYCVGKEGICSSAGQGSTGTSVSSNASTAVSNASSSASSSSGQVVSSTTGTTTTREPIDLPGFRCMQRSAGIPGVHGARIAMTTLMHCAAMCTTAPTCRALEWHAPDYCFLITQSLSRSAFTHGSHDGIWFVCSRLHVAIQTTTTTRGTASTATFTTTAATSTWSSRVDAPHIEQDTSGVNQQVPEGPGWYPWLSILMVPILCCAGELFRRRFRDRRKVRESYGDQQKVHQRNVKAARAWAMGTDSQGAAGFIPQTRSSVGYVTSASGCSETVRVEFRPRTITPESPSEHVSHSKSWSESVRVRAFSQLRRTRPLFADNEKPQSADSKPRRHRSAPPGSVNFKSADHENAWGSSKLPGPRFSAAWEGSYGSSSGRSGDSFAKPCGPRTAADADADEKASWAAPEGWRSKPKDSAGCGDFKAQRRSRSEGAGLSGPESRWSKTADKAEPSSGRVRGQRTPSPGTPRPSPPPRPPETSPPTPPPPSSGQHRPSRVQQLAEEMSNSNADTPREALSPISLALELARLRESNTLVVRKRYWKEQCLRWHPDKNAGDEQNATRMFQVLQEKKEWFLSDK